MKQITVGVDASPESTAAVRWAAEEAAQRRLPLHLVHLWLLRSMTAQTIPHEEALLRAAQRLLDESETDVRTRFPTVRVTSELVSTETPDALLTAGGDSAQNEMLVLGSQGLGAVPGFLLGSVGLHGVAHATCPVVLVRAVDDPSRSGPGPVAVGVSSRTGQEAVLEFAFAAASRHGTPLVAVHAASRHPALIGRDELGHHAGADRDVEQLHETLRPWRDKFPTVHVVEHLSHESPARAVVGVAPGAGLLVVGRGHHPAIGPHIGPVTHAAIHHALCPVVTVPHG
ncbi:universal stress protein [Streptacidiphilus jiangxiensis]|uniref:Nucleotide-binding universal stress protein, UspA family n=1 Tax=Streptacidiphilus jiangxiensis TaxID=235985 RepID=A0A1H7QTU8_STRJI|nr:universal stress protein [Streptacidiphilus jiangxiensis]SEL51421.1 Nucleotide-binding universal stress protein, UspA family [Streptacidiphilus jiangxiensis]